MLRHAVRCLGILSSQLKLLYTYCYSHFHIPKNNPIPNPKRVQPQPWRCNFYFCDDNYHHKIGIFYIRNSAAFSHVFPQKSLLKEPFLILPKSFFLNQFLFPRCDLKHLAGAAMSVGYCQVVPMIWTQYPHTKLVRTICQTWNALLDLSAKYIRDEVLGTL